VVLDIGDPKRIASIVGTPGKHNGSANEKYVLRRFTMPHAR
jgi:hypothetical protein